MSRYLLLVLALVTALVSPLVAFDSTPTITTTSLPAGMAGRTYNAPLEATGGLPPYTWSADGLPAGLTINASTGRITGVPSFSQPSPWSVVIGVVDSAIPRFMVRRQLSLMVYPECNPGSSSLPTGIVGTYYQATLVNSCGGLPPYTWSATGLPSGLTLNPFSGVISGIPTVPFSDSVIVAVHDSSSPPSSASYPLQLTITRGLTIATTSLLTGTAGAPYSSPLAAVGGVPPYTWSAAVLPAPLTINPASGLISGIPDASFTGDVTITVRDSASPQGSAVAVLPLAITSALTITTASLPSGKTGMPFSAQMAATGGAPPYSWFSSLPAPLIINSLGVIAGIPTDAFSGNVTITVYDSSPAQNRATQTFSLTINPATSALTIMTPSLANATVGVAYNALVIATGGTPPYTWSVAGLPAPMGIDPLSGQITGTPDVPQFPPGSVTVTVQDSATPPGSASRSYPLTVNPAFVLSAASLPNGVVGVFYNSSVLSVTGGMPPYTWSVTGLPAPLSFSVATGQISGTPTAPFSGSVTFTVHDSSNPPNNASQTLPLGIYAGLTITTTSLLPGSVGAPYATPLAAAGGMPPYTWSAAGLLPPLTINPASGQISGAPAAAYAGDVTITVKDSASPQASASATLLLTINPSLTITTTSLPSGTAHTAYSAQLAATGGSPPYSWAATLPPGLTINSSGQIGGVPTAAFTGTVTVTVLDSSPAPYRTSRDFSLTIDRGIDPLTVVTTALANGVAGLAYSAPVAATGGVPPYTWSAAGLPAPLTINPASGQIGGVPVAAFSGNVTVTVRDNGSPQASASRTLALAIAGLAITTTSLPAGSLGGFYSAPLAAAGGVPPYTWSAAGLPLPLRINAVSGQISGSPDTLFTGNITVAVRDSATPQASASATLALTINPSLTITTTSLPAGMVGVVYSTQLAAIGGTPPYSWFASLPEPLTINSSGQISGAPAATFTGRVTITVSDSSPAQNRVTQNFSLTINPSTNPPGGGLTITTASLPAGSAGVLYAATLAASGGTQPYTWSAAGLPSSLAVNASTGQISGTPTAGFAGNVTITVRDSASPQGSGSATLALTINPSLTITTASLPSGTVGMAYNAQLAATGGTPPYSWSASLPALLTISSSGQISGAPAEAFTGNVTVTVTDSSPTQKRATRDFVLTVNPATPTLTITTATLPNATVGAPYSALVAATGGALPYTWSATGLPAALAINAATGQITGTATVPQLSPGNAIVTVKDSASPPNSASRTYSLTVNSALVVTTATLPNGAVGAAYSSTPAATGGVPPYTWSATGLPAALTLNPSSGQITGTPTAPFSASVTFTVHDSSVPQNSASQTLPLTIGSGLTITTTSLLTGSVGAFYTASLAVAGGTPPYAWSAAGLPAPLRLNSATGQISGSPESPFTGNIAISVKDSASPQGSAAATLALNINGPLTVTTTALPSGAVGAPYSAQVAATGGTPPYSWFASLPPNLTFGSSGQISGTPAAAFTGRVTVTVSDSSPSQNRVTQYFSLTIAPSTSTNFSGSARLALGADVASADFSTYAPGQNPDPVAADPPFQVRYAANLQFGESFIDISNSGANGAPLLGPGFGNPAGNICVNVYAFSPDEQEISCCSCLVTPNGLVNLGVNRDLVAKTLTGVIPTSVVVKLVATLAGPGGTGTSCANSAAAVSVENLAPGLLAWGTTSHPTPAQGVFATTETPFSPATLSPDELASIVGRCAFILSNGSGFGICSSCRAGALGGSRQ
ncbi:MAG: putative Ig domain-containing protein [Acidobacteriia bacterium]|nr:putative Ig domain-containing protein [Terriglobia bacterium]